MTDLRKRLELPVFPLLVLVLALCTPAWLHAAETDGPATEGAQEMCGAMGEIEFKPADWIGTKEPPYPITWWVDSDGVDPGTAGCHEGLKARDGERNGRMFGEACLPNGLLVETNPDADEQHSHKNDIGHPDTFDCKQWCACQGFAKGGRCVAESAPPCRESAKCACSN
jgi:hypothetical protein